MKKMTKTDLFRAAHSDKDLKGKPYKVVSVYHAEQSITVKVTDKYGVRHPDPAKRCKRVTHNMTYQFR